MCDVACRWALLHKFLLSNFLCFFASFTFVGCFLSSFWAEPLHNTCAMKEINLLKNMIFIKFGPGGTLPFMDEWCYVVVLPQFCNLAKINVSRIYAEVLSKMQKNDFGNLWKSISHLDTVLSLLHCMWQNFVASEWHKDWLKSQRVKCSKETLKMFD